MPIILQSGSFRCRISPPALPVAVPRFGGQRLGSHRRATRAAHVARTAIRVGPPALFIGEPRHWLRRPSSGGLQGAGAQSFALRELLRPLRPDAAGPSRCASWPWRARGQPGRSFSLIRGAEAVGAGHPGRLSTRTLLKQSDSPAAAHGHGHPSRPGIFVGASTLRPLSPWPPHPPCPPDGPCAR